MEIVFDNSDQDSSLQFGVERRIPPTYYVIHPFSELTSSYVDQVIDLAKTETALVLRENDLDTVPDLSNLGFNVELFRFTHALEHLTVVELTKMSLRAFFRAKMGQECGRTAIYYPTGSKIRTGFIGFEITPGLSPIKAHEQRALERACGKVSLLFAQQNQPEV